ncbi:hypothetical protein [Siminovitchia sp. 179-K 8D1 HS]|uniref:hypothetical protein n=1 Tax=Siminovitchia sp. 179-K 8D1 HS TaxID=3142385 RepID=UPI00399F93FD
MVRQIRRSEKVLIAGLGFILLFMMFHDWVPLGPLNDVDSVAVNRPISELVIVTLFGTVQIMLLMGMVLFFIGKTYPLWIKLWLVIHQSFIMAGVLIDWWIPYFFGIGAENRVESYKAMFGNTHSFLPVMHGIVPNTIHVIFHATLLICLILTPNIIFTNKINRNF